MVRLIRCCLVLWRSAWVATGWAMPSIEATGLMRDMAILLIEGRQEVLRVGQRSSSGVKLLAADAQRASVEVDGETF